MSDMVIELPDETLSEVIRKSVGETDEKLKNRVELFKQWLYSENYLPKDVDLAYIKNFIRVSKFDILKARKKFEFFMAAKASWSNFFNYNRLISDDVFMFPMHKRATTSRRLTKDGYRIWSVQFNRNDIPYICVDHFLAYGYLIGEYLLWKDLSRGIIIIIDLNGFYTEFVANTNFKTFKICLDVFFKVMPFRIKNIHICSLTTASKVLLNIGLMVVSEKMKQRIVYHKSTATLNKYIDLDDLPKEYGGSAESVELVGEDYKKCMFENRQLVQAIANQKPIAPLPKERRKYLGDFEMSLDGSFRKLEID